MRILVADDDRTLQTALRGVLPSWGYEPVIVQTGDKAWELLQRDDAPRLAILDWVMPGLDGLGLCRLVRARQSPQYTYLILLTGQSSRDHAVEALEAGADDFITKPFHPNELRARLHPGRRILELERELARRANYDFLTGLPNRTLLAERFGQTAEYAKRRGEMFALLYLDLDGFKKINDTYGHLQGDLYLKGFADRLRNSIRKSDTLARVGGDEFVLLAGGISAPGKLPRLVEKLRRAIAKPLPLQGGTVLPSASIGLSIYPVDGQDLATLQQIADQAMYRSKRKNLEDAADVNLFAAIEQ